MTACYAVCCHWHLSQQGHCSWLQPAAASVAQHSERGADHGSPLLSACLHRLCRQHTKRTAKKAATALTVVAATGRGSNHPAWIVPLVLAVQARFSAEHSSRGLHVLLFDALFGMCIHCRMCIAQWSSSQSAVQVLYTVYLLVSVRGICCCPAAFSCC
jgi:hypothetical protein